MPARQFLLRFNLSTFTGARAEAWGEEGLPLHSPGSEPDVQAEPTGFRGQDPRTDSSCDICPCRPAPPGAGPP